MFVPGLTDSLPAQRAHTHGRRVRHSSSESSDSDSAESGSSSLRSHSPSPELHPDPPSPASARPLSNNKEVRNTSATRFDSAHLFNSTCRSPSEFMCLKMKSPQMG